MMTLVRSALSRERVVEGRRVLIDPPNVREALEILATQEGYRAMEPNDAGVFRDALRRWLPPEMSDIYAKEDALEERVLPVIMDLILEGIPEPDERKETAGSSSIRNPFGNLIGSYSRVYGCDPWKVYCETPWPFFLLFVKESVRQSAIQRMEALKASLVQHMKSSDMDRMNRDFREALQMEATDEYDSAQAGLKMLKALKADQNANTRSG